MTEKKMSGSAVLTLLLVAVLLVVPVAAWHAYVLCALWGWFVTPLFGVPVPGLWIAAGLTLLLKLPFASVKSEYPSEGTTGDRVIHIVIYSGFAPALALLFGWVFALLAGTA